MSRRRGSANDRHTDPIGDLRRKASEAPAELGPEDVFALLHAPDTLAVTAALKELSAGWPRCPCFPKIPMGSWADAVRALIEGGVAGVVAFSRGNRDLMRIACGTLASAGSAQAADVSQVNSALGGLIEMAHLGADGTKWLAALEGVLFARGADVEPLVASRLRELLHARTTDAVDEDGLLLATDVLRYVGDESSIALLESYVPSSSVEVDMKSWQGTRQSIIAEIRKRCRRRNGDHCDQAV